MRLDERSSRLDVMPRNANNTRMNLLNMSEVRVAAPPLPALAAPLTHGLDAVAGVSFEMMPLEKLAACFRNEELDCALLPPLLAVGNPLARIVPGIGLVLETEGAAAFCLGGDLDGPVRVGLLRGAAVFETVVRIILAERYGAEVQAAPAAGDTGEGLDAVVAMGRAAQTGVWAAHHDLYRLWVETTDTPLAVLVWACRVRAPHARVRQVLAAAQQRGLAECEALAERPYSYVLASEAAAGLRKLVALGRRHGVCRADTEVSFC